MVVMGIDTSVYVGPYVAARWRRVLDSEHQSWARAYEAWEDETNEALREARPMIGELLEGWSVFIPNDERETGGYFVDPHDNEVRDLPEAHALTAVLEEYRDEIAGLRRLFSDVEIRIGVLAWCW